jgi:hypothetical protein
MRRMMPGRMTWRMLWSTRERQAAVAAVDNATEVNRQPELDNAMSRYTDAALAAEQAASLAAAVAEIDEATEVNRQLELANAMSRYTDAVALAAAVAEIDEAIDARVEAWAKACTAVKDAICISDYARKNATDAYNSMEVCERNVDTMYDKVNDAGKEYDALPMGTADSVLDEAMLKYDHLFKARKLALKELDQAKSVFNEAAKCSEVAIADVYTALAAETALST